MTGIKKHFIKANCNKNINIEEKLFCSCYMWGLAIRFFLNKVKKLAVYFRLHESSWVFHRRALRKKCPYWELFWCAIFPHFPALGLNTERYVSLRIQSKCGKMQEKCGPEQLQIPTLFTQWRKRNRYCLWEINLFFYINIISLMFQHFKLLFFMINLHFQSTNLSWKIAV